MTNGLYLSTKKRVNQFPGPDSLKNPILSIYSSFHNNDINEKDVYLFKSYKKKLLINLKTRESSNKISKKMVSKINILLRRNVLIKVISYFIVTL